MSKGLVRLNLKSKFTVRLEFSKPSTHIPRGGGGGAFRVGKGWFGVGLRLG